MSNNDMSYAVQSDERVWPDDELRIIALDVAESEGTWSWQDDALQFYVRDTMLNKYGTVRYCGPTRDNGIPFTTADVQRVADMLKGATITLADEHPAIESVLQYRGERDGKAVIEILTTDKAGEMSDGNPDIRVYVNDGLVYGDEQECDETEGE